MGYQNSKSLLDRFSQSHETSLLDQLKRGKMDGLWKAWGKTSE